MLFTQLKPYSTTHRVRRGDISEVGRKLSRLPACFLAISALMHFVAPSVSAASDAITFDEPFTIIAHVRFNDARSDPIVWLAGLAAEEDGSADVLHLRWSQDASGWFPMWRLSLAAPAQLLSQGLADRYDGELALVDLADIRPRADQEYRAVLSYDPELSTLSILAEDETGSSVLVAANLQIRPPAGSFFPVSGWAPGRMATDAPVKTVSLDVSAMSVRYGLPLPFSRGFRVASRSNEYLKGEPVRMRIDWPAIEIPGEVRISLVTSGAKRLLATRTWIDGTEEIVFDADAFPIGESFLVLEHIHGPHRTEVARLSVRLIEAKIQASYTLFGRDYDRNALIGEIALIPDLGVVEGAELIVRGALIGRDDVAPTDSTVVIRRRIDELHQPLTLPFEVPVPPESVPLTLRLESSVEPDAVAVGDGVRQFALRGGAVSSDPTLFPFVVNPWQVSPDNVTNISHWLERPAGKHGFVTVRDGHFVAGNGSPIRFLGVNCSFSGCFPDHASAERIAKQLARFGINLVRFHHMDMQEAPGGIWRRGAFPRELDSQQLDRLDYFIYQLKENGIYSNLNLHVSRTMSPWEGYPEPDRRPDFDKGLSLFDAGIIEHQKAYARDLLTHRNPYTGSRYVDEPAIAMIEITNENGLILLAQWGGIDALPPMYQEPLDARWRAWLTDRYGSTEALAAAWGAGEGSAGYEIAANGGFDMGLEHWSLEVEADGHADMRVVPTLPGETDPAPGARFLLEVRVFEKGAVSWRPQVYHTDLSLTPGAWYLVSYWIKSDRPHIVSSHLAMHHDPWTGFGTYQTEVNTEWRRVEFTVRVPEGVEVREGRAGFNNLEAVATYWIAGLSVQAIEGDGIGLRPGEDLTTVGRPTWQSLGLRSTQVRHDYIDFIWDVEQAYFEEMHRFIKDELGANASVSGTQVQWSPPGIQAGLDYVDVHGYWNHPDFPGEGWDASEWYVRNTSMTESESGGTITTLASVRVAGKPYVISEYNHPAPITYGSETFLLTSAYAAFQDWDGLIAFAWSHDTDFWPQRLTNFFDIKSHPTKLVTFPAVAALFLRGDVREGEEVVYAHLPDDVQRRRLLDSSVMGVGSADVGVHPLTALLHRLAIVVDGAGGDGADHAVNDVGKTSAPAPAGPVLLSDTGELTWEMNGIGRTVVTIDAVRSKAVIGYAAQRTFTLSGVTVTPGRTRQHGWSAITLTVMDGSGFAGPGRILITATGHVENVGMGWERLDDTVTVRNRWGDAPTVVEGVPARIELPVPPDRITAYALDGAGRRREPLPVRPSEHESDRSVIDIGPKYRTLWYEIEVRDFPD